MAFDTVRGAWALEYRACGVCVAYSATQILRAQCVKAMSGANEQTQHRRIILLIEDDASTAVLLTKLLGRHGFNVVLAEDGRQAMRRVAAPPPALILTELMIPYANGFEVIRHFRATPGWDKVPIMVLTSQVDEGDVEHALVEGANDFLTKPFSHRELIARIEHHLIA